MSDPSPDTPSLADRIDMTRIITAGDGHRSIVLQSSVSDSDLRAAAARLRKLDRIEALGSVSSVRRAAEVVAEGYSEVLAGRLVRLADALEVPDADT